MRNKIFYIVKFIIITSFLFIFITNNTLIVDSLFESFNIFYNNLFPSLFSFFILTDFIVNYGYLSYFKYFKLKLFDILIFSMLSSYLCSSILINKNKYLDKKDIYNIISFTSFPNIIFTIYVVGKGVFNSAKIGIILLIINYLSNYIVYFIKYKELKDIDYYYDKKKLGLLIKDSVINASKNLVIIYGSFSIFLTIINIIKYYFNISNYILLIISSFLDINSAFKLLSGINIPMYIKIVISSFILSFSTLSIILEQISIIDRNDISIIKIIKNKIITSLISIILSIIFILLKLY